MTGGASTHRLLGPHPAVAADLPPLRRGGAEVRPRHAPSLRVFAKDGFEVVERTGDTVRLAVGRKGGAS